MIKAKVDTSSWFINEESAQDADHVVLAEAGTYMAGQVYGVKPDRKSVLAVASETKFQPERLKTYIGRAAEAGFGPIVFGTTAVGFVKTALDPSRREGWEGARPVRPVGYEDAGLTLVEEQLGLFA